MNRLSESELLGLERKARDLYESAARERLRLGCLGIELSEKESSDLSLKEMVAGDLLAFASFIRSEK